MLQATLAKWRQPLTHLGVLAGGLAALGIVVAVALPFMPAEWQRPLLDGLTWVPGLSPTEQIVQEGGQVKASSHLIAGWKRRAIAAEFPAHDEGWERDRRVSVRPALALVLGAWGLVLGTAVTVLWHGSGFRRPLLVSTVVGACFGIFLALSLTAMTGNWPAYWLKGMAGLPGITASTGGAQRVGDFVLDSKRALRSDSGVLATHPNDEPPWTSSDRPVSVTPRGRAWFAGYGVLFALGFCALTVALQHRRRWVSPVLAAVGLALLLWLPLPFLPRGQQELALQGLAKLPLVEVKGRSAADGSGQIRDDFIVRETTLAELPVMPTWEPGTSVEVHPAMAAFLAGLLVLVLTPAWLLTLGVAAMRRRRADARGHLEAEEALPPTSIPLSDGTQR